MRIVKLTKETTENILENMLKRSPTQYGTYEASVQEIIENVSKDRCSGWKVRSFYNL